MGPSGSHLICTTDFNIGGQGVTLTLPPETFTDKSLTELELEALALIAAQRERKKEAFKSKKPVTAVNDGPVAPSGEGPKEPKQSAAETVAHDTIPPPDNEQQAESSEEEANSEEASVDDQKKTTGGEPDGDEAKADDGAETAEGDEGDWVDEEEGGDEKDGVAEAPEETTADPEGEAEEKEGKPGKASHEGVRCDGCGVGLSRLRFNLVCSQPTFQGPTIGVRYKCADCRDYDLCEDCIASGAHNTDHTFLPIVTDADDTILSGDVSPVADSPIRRLTAQTQVENDYDLGNQVVIGLRVYTKREAPASVRSQRR